MDIVDWAQRHAFARAVLLAAQRAVNGAVHPVWIDDTRFWYEREGDGGAEFCIADAARGERLIAITRAAIAQPLGRHLDAPVDADTLIIAWLFSDPDHGTITCDAFDHSYALTLDGGDLTTRTKTANLTRLASSDRTLALLLRDDNLFTREVAGDEESALTSDGSTYNAYAAPPAAARGLRTRHGREAPDAPWSPDGRWVLILQTDGRHGPDPTVTDYAPDQGIRPAMIDNRGER